MSLKAGQDINIIYCASPTEFYVTNDAEKFEVLSKKIKFLENKEAVTQLHVGRTYIANSVSNKDFYRGVILSQTATNATVKYYDFGDVETLPIKGNFFKIPKPYESECYTFCCSMPADCFDCNDDNKKLLMELFQTAMDEISTFNIESLSLRDNGTFMVHLTADGDNILNLDSIPYEKMKEPSKLVLRNDAKINLLHYVSLDEMYFTSDYKQWQRVMQVLRRNITLIPCPFIYKGSRYLVRSKLHSDSELYRGRVLDIDYTTHEISVFYCDYGDVEKLDREHFFMIPQELQSIPDMALKISFPKLWKYDKPQEQRFELYFKEIQENCKNLVVFDVQANSNYFLTYYAKMAEENGNNIYDKVMGEMLKEKNRQELPQMPVVQPKKLISSPISSSGSSERLLSNSSNSSISVTSDIKLKVGDKVVVTYFRDNSHFFVMKESRENEFIELKSIIKSKVSSNSLKTVKDVKVKSGVLVKKGDMFLRGVITKSDPNDCSISYIDMGNVDCNLNIARETILEPTSDMNYEPFAILCAVDGDSEVIDADTKLEVTEIIGRKKSRGPIEIKFKISSEVTPPCTPKKEPKTVKINGVSYDDDNASKINSLGKRVDLLEKENSQMKRELDILKKRYNDLLNLMKME